MAGSDPPSRRGVTYRVAWIVRSNSNCSHPRYSDRIRAMSLPRLPRRDFLGTAAATAAGFLFSGSHWKAAGALKKKVKITDVKVMIVRGTWDWNLIKIETDQPGLYGIGEAYWG